MLATGTDWKRMQDGYRRSIADRIADVRALLETLGGAESDLARTRLDALRRDLHKLHGSAGTWGFQQVGEVAGRIETLVASWIDGGSSRPIDTEIDALRGELEALEAAAATGPEKNGAAPRGVHALLIHDDPEVRGQVWETVSTRGWRLETADSVDGAIAGRALSAYQLIAIGGAGAASDDVTSIQRLREAARGVPIVALLETNSAIERIAAAGAGADLVLAGPHDGHALFGAWDRLLSPAPALGERVLLIDDDPGFQKFLRTALESWGLEVEVLDDPLHVFARAAAAPPDLLILDLEMPTVRGPDILRALRSSPEWRDLPAIVVTGHDDPQRRLEAFEAGADRVLVKPVRAHELKGAILAGVRRGRELDSFSAATPRGASSDVDVFVIEDDTALLEMLQYALTNRGFRCQAFTNGREALDALLAVDTQDRKPVVLLDVDLPGLDGFSALQQIHRARPGDFQIVIVTVHSGEREQIKALRCGASDYLVKPVSIPVVVAKVERLSRPGVQA